MRSRKFFKEIQETNERVGGSKQEIQDHKQEKNMDPDSRNESGKHHRIDMTYKTLQFTDLEELDMRKKMQDDSSNLCDAPLHKTLPNTMKSAGTDQGNREGRKYDTNEIIGEGQEIEANNMESEMPWSSQEVPTKTAVPTADNLPNSSELANIAERDVKAEIDQSRGILQGARYQKLNSIAQANEESNTIFTDTEQRLDGTHSSSTHVQNAEMALVSIGNSLATSSEVVIATFLLLLLALIDCNLDTENDKETEDEDHSKGSAAALQGEGEDLN
ncbi:hypothetical protein CQW23_06074 [Capsicum baccatum]|uniref:Uncharacterized protein n=1 Tax=Capsicum baccatum TaxID=33114 RepID=A0A2G2X293_CAPBA|nr:hypothetical protein CQW23_06074 [Capsicum baccatum]